MSNLKTRKDPRSDKIPVFHLAHWSAEENPIFLNILSLLIDYEISYIIPHEIEGKL
jgi:hypothetical protein